MKITNRRNTRRTHRYLAGNTKGHGADLPREPATRPYPGTPEPVSVGPDTYEVRCDFVPTSQGADPAQIPWLEEFRGERQPNDTVSGVI